MGGASSSVGVVRIVAHGWPGAGGHRLSTLPKFVPRLSDKSVESDRPWGRQAASLQASSGNPNLSECLDTIIFNSATRAPGTILFNDLLGRDLRSTRTLRLSLSFSPSHLPCRAAFRETGAQLRSTCLGGIRTPPRRSQGQGSRICVARQAFGAGGRSVPSLLLP